MIRILVLLLFLCLGLAAAVLWNGTMYHMRLAVPEGLPAWTDAAAPEATLPHGTARIEGRGSLPALRLRWDVAMPDANGLHWTLRITGDGVEATGDLAVSYTMSEARFTLTDGTFDLSRLALLPAPVEGAARGEGGTLTATDPLGTPTLAGTLTGRIVGIDVAGADFGAGPVTLDFVPDGGWTADASLSGGLTGTYFSLSGTRTDPAATYEIVLEDGGDLPDILRGLLSAAGRQEGDGWVVQGTTSLY